MAPGPPRARSAKIMRKIAGIDCAALGGTSTLADPGIAEALIDKRRNRG